MSDSSSDGFRDFSSSSSDDAGPLSPAAAPVSKSPKKATTAVKPTAQQVATSSKTAESGAAARATSDSSGSSPRSTPRAKNVGKQPSRLAAYDSPPSSRSSSSGKGRAARRKDITPPGTPPMSPSSSSSSSFHHRSLSSSSSSRSAVSPTKSGRDLSAPPKQKEATDNKKKAMRKKNNKTKTLGDPLSSRSTSSASSTGKQAGGASPPSTVSSPSSVEATVQSTKMLSVQEFRRRFHQSVQESHMIRHSDVDTRRQTAPSDSSGHSDAGSPDEVAASPKKKGRGGSTVADMIALRRERALRLHRSLPNNEEIERLSLEIASHQNKTMELHKKYKKNVAELKTLRHTLQWFAEGGDLSKAVSKKRRKELMMAGRTLAGGDGSQRSMYKDPGGSPSKAAKKPGSDLQELVAKLEVESMHLDDQITKVKSDSKVSVMKETSEVIEIQYGLIAELQQSLQHQKRHVKGSKAAAIDDAQQAASSKQEQLKSLKKKSKSAQADLQALKARHQELEEAQRKQLGQARDVEQRLAELRAAPVEIQRLQARIKESEGERQRVASATTKVVDQNEAEKRHLKQELEDMREKIKEREKERTSLAKKESELKSTAASLEKNLESNADRRAALVKEVEERVEKETEELLKELGQLAADKERALKQEIQEAEERLREQEEKRAAQTKEHEEETKQFNQREKERTAELLSSAGKFSKQQQSEQEALVKEREESLVREREALHAEKAAWEAEMQRMHEELTKLEEATVGMGTDQTPSTVTPSSQARSTPVVPGPVGVINQSSSPVGVAVQPSTVMQARAVQPPKPQRLDDTQSRSSGSHDDNIEPSVVSPALGVVVSPKTKDDSKPIRHGPPDLHEKAGRYGTAVPTMDTETVGGVDVRSQSSFASRGMVDSTMGGGEVIDDLITVHSQTSPKASVAGGAAPSPAASPGRRPPQPPMPTGVKAPVPAAGSVGSSSINRGSSGADSDSASGSSPSKAPPSGGAQLPVSAPIPAPPPPVPTSPPAAQLDRQNTDSSSGLGPVSPLTSLGNTVEINTKPPPQPAAQAPESTPEAIVTKEPSTAAGSEQLPSPSGRSTGTAQPTSTVVGPTAVMLADKSGDDFSDFEDDDDSDSDKLGRGGDTTAVPSARKEPAGDQGRDSSDVDEDLPSYSDDDDDDTSSPKAIQPAAAAPVTAAQLLPEEVLEDDDSLDEPLEDFDVIEDDSD